MKKRTTLYVDAELLSKFKQKCKDEGTSMSKQYERMIRGYITEATPTEDTITVTDSMSIELNNRTEAKSWIRQKLGL